MGCLRQMINAASRLMSIARRTATSSTADIRMSLTVTPHRPLPVNSLSRFFRLAVLIRLTRAIGLRRGGRPPVRNATDGPSLLHGVSTVLFLCLACIAPPASQCDARAAQPVVGQTVVGQTVAMQTVAVQKTAVRKTGVRKTGVQVVAPAAADAALQYYAASVLGGDYESCRSVAEQMYAAGVRQDSDQLTARGLVRLADCEVRFARWGSWERFLNEAESLCGENTLAHAELLMFRGHINGKWQGDLSRGMAQLREAILAAKVLEDDVLLAEAELRIADLIFSQGHYSAARDAALSAWETARFTGIRTSQIWALRLLARSFYEEEHPHLALPYAERLQQLRPDSQIALAIVSRFSPQPEYIEQLRKDIASSETSADTSADTSVATPKQRANLARLHTRLAECLQGQNRHAEAAEQLGLAAALFEKAGFRSQLSETLIRQYTLCLRHELPFPASRDTFLNVMNNPECEITPRMMDDIVEVLKQLDSPDLLTTWKDRRTAAVEQQQKLNHELASVAARSNWDLEQRRRQLAADVSAQQASSRVVNTTLITGLVVLGIAFLLAYVRAGRKAISRLQAEVLQRKSEQARNERLTEQLLQAQKLDALGTLAAGTAHDFNNTLQAILTLSELLRETLPDSDESQHHVAAIQQVAEQGGTLTRGMLTFSGEYETEKRTIDLIPLVSEMQSMVRHLMPSSIAISMQVHDSHRRILCRANEAQLKQVILNLVINAKDAMPNGGDLGIDVHCNAESERARICVSDTGSGIHTDVLQRVFEPFFTTKDRGQGTGLGLSMVHGIVEDHGGDVTIDSEAGRGTSVQITLPLCDKADFEVASGLPLHYSAHGRRVLVVDDNLHFLNALCTQLEELGFLVHTATDGVSALETYAEMPAEPELMLMDLDLPEQSGKECHAAMMEKGATGLVIFMSGLSTESTDSTVLTKPFTRSELLAAIISADENRTTAMPQDRSQEH